MAIRGFNESSLTDSEIFTGLRASAETDPVEKARKLVNTAKRLTNEDIEGAYIQIKQYPNTLSRAAIRAFDEGTTAIIYNDVPSLTLTPAIPFITFLVNNKRITYIFMDKHIRKNRDGILSVDAPVLHDMLTGALIANRLKTNYDKLESNQFLQKLLMDIYTKFVCRIINREYSIGADKIVYDTIQYWINKFFLIRIFGSRDTSESIDIASSKHFKYLDEMKIEDIKRLYNEANPIKFSDLLGLLKTTTPRMKTLGLDTFLSNWINYYYPPAMLAIDNMEYLIFMIITLLRGNNIINISAGEIVKETRNIKILNEELLKLI